MTLQTWIIRATIPAGTPAKAVIPATIQRSIVEPELTSLSIGHAVIRRIFTTDVSHANAVLIISKGGMSFSLNLPETALLITQNQPAGFLEIELTGGDYSFAVSPTVNTGPTPAEVVFYVEVEVYY